MQKFNYHCHTNFGGYFDGSNSADEMLTTYKEKGFTSVGISNHFIYHPSVNTKLSTQFFDNTNKLLDVYKANFDNIEEAASKHNIKVFKGMEVDYFPSLSWNNAFEKMIKELNPDYIIGTTHFIRTADESKLYHIYNLNSLPNVSKEEKDDLVRNYWYNVELSIKSGYFNFIAHPDYCCQFNLATTDDWNDIKYKVIDAFISTKTPCEVNTGGIARIGRPFPDWWIVEELIKNETPLLISDDSHRIEDTGRHFLEVEEKLSKLGCKKRFTSL